VKIIIPILLLLAVGVAAGCSSDSTEPPPELDCSSVADTTQPATVSYQNDIFPMFADVAQGGYGCNTTGCHLTPLGSSDFTVTTYEDLFHAGSQARSLEMCSIKPGDPDASYIVWKIEGRAGIQGVRMPESGVQVTPGDLQLMRTWILEGARNN
jgi:hypothetical protein